ncbi:hypothetical protein O6H91_14G001200 [Diphasiastrum complanatum]|uniref:Uncharacterized protein n=1 Tax=Diphasiastrum complanatum TaxID=34168 RepID=A0ACC2BKR7_DIPCM|nr:hypothetical protein O6H91_14G001200 [Diphasiastrum complanatum]
MEPWHGRHGFLFLILLIFAAMVVPGLGYDPLKLKALTKCVSESTENNTLERWIRCVESSMGLIKHKQAGIQSQRHATGSKDSSRPSSAFEADEPLHLHTLQNPSSHQTPAQNPSSHARSEPNLHTNGGTGRQTSHEHNRVNGRGGERVQTREEAFQSRASHPKWALDQNMWPNFFSSQKSFSGGGRSKAWSMEPRFYAESDQGVWARNSDTGNDMSSEFDAQDGKEFYSIVEFRRVDYSVTPGRLGKGGGFCFDSLLKLVLIVAIAILVWQLLNRRKNRASVMGYSSKNKANFFRRPTLNEKPPKERSFKGNSRKDGVGRSEEQEMGQKEGDFHVVFAHLGNAVAAVLAELLRSESNFTNEIFKADDFLELLEPAMESSISLFSSGNFHPCLEVFKKSFKSTFTMLNNIHCARLKLFKKRTHFPPIPNMGLRGSTKKRHFLNGSYDAKEDIPNQVIDKEVFSEECSIGLEQSISEEQYHSCDDATDISMSGFRSFDQEVESSSCTENGRVIESRKQERMKPKLGKLKLSSHTSNDIRFFPCSSHSTLSELNFPHEPKFKNSSKEIFRLTRAGTDPIQKVRDVFEPIQINKGCTNADVYEQHFKHPSESISAHSTTCDGDPSVESRIKDLRLVHCTTSKGSRTLYSKDMSGCDVQTEILYEQVKSNVLSPQEYAIEKISTAEAPRDIDATSQSIQSPSEDLAEETSSFVYENGVNAPEEPMELVQRRPIHTVGMLHEAVILNGSNFDSGFSADCVWRQALLDAFERSVDVQQHHNYIKSVKLAHSFKRLSLEEQQLHLTSESNNLMKQNMALNKSRVKFKLWKAFDKKMETAYMELNKTVADELIAGLVVMLVALLFGGWKFSYNRLSEVVQSCQQSEPTLKEHQKWSWFQTAQWYSGPIAALSSQFQSLICRVTVVGRMAVGITLLALIASSLFRHSITHSSQGMPVTILLVVLGGICGFVGKLSVQSLGGSGMYWLIIWESICLVHAFATCFTPTLYYLLNGVSANHGGESKRHWVPPWIRQFVFHTTLVLLLPTMAGLVPFAPFREVIQVLGFAFFDKFAMLRQTFLESIIPS